MFRSIGSKVIKRFEITKCFSAFNTMLTYQQQAPQTIKFEGDESGVLRGLMTSTTVHDNPLTFWQNAIFSTV